MIARELFGEDHELYRQTTRRFLEQEVAPHHDQWEEQGYVDRAVWLKAGELGLLCPTMPEAYGGAGVDRRYSVILMEEIARVNATGLGFGLHSEIVAPYLLHYGTEAQKQHYLPAMARGEMIGAIAMTEPAAGSDLQGIRTTASDEGDHFVVNGSKTFITNGWHADVVITVVKTNPAAGAKGTSLLLIDRGMDGFEKGRRLKKVGMKAQDTAELFFDQVKVPKSQLLGHLNQGF
ncbi:MAG: acyl-CoA dehydrogenase, partial [Betaproteobacteria bacterium]|nr:acyl-CoA dehydrogenase [Betaproteobacteria bacterium]